MLIVSDLIAKYVIDIQSTEVIHCPGISTNGSASVLRSGQLVLGKQFTMFHVGINGTPHFDEGAILSCYNDFVTNRRTNMLMSSILPRPKYYEVSKEKVKNVN